jgi:hypothetical protein
MRLIDAYNLLVEDGIADNCRYFAELYKYFQFRDEQLLKEYLQFIIQEPADWIRGFPTKLTTKTSFSKPKTAVIKLLKKDAVRNAVTAAFADKVHDIIWKTYKQTWESVLNARERARTPRMSVMDHFDAESVEEQPLPTLPASRTHSERDADMESTVSFEQEDVEHISIVENTETSNVISTSNIAAPVKIQERTDSEKVAILKEVILKLSETLQPSVTDAFRLLLSQI